MFYVNDEPEGKFFYTETIKLHCIVMDPHRQCLGEAVWVEGQILAQVLLHVQVHLHKGPSLCVCPLHKTAHIKGNIYSFIIYFHFSVILFVLTIHFLVVVLVVVGCYLYTNQLKFYFMSVHSKVILDETKNKKTCLLNVPRDHLLLVVFESLFLLF